jgi:hypothetical protein
MPRDPSGVYTTPAGTNGVPNTTILSAAYNTNVADVANDLNTPRPIVAGGTGASTAAQALINIGGVNKTGDTMTGNLTLNTANPTLVLQKSASGNAAYIVSYTGTNARWSMALGDGTAETGGNAGSNFNLTRYNDAGTSIGSPITITRSNGNIQLGPNTVNSGGYVVSVLAPNVAGGNGLAVYAGTGASDVSFRAVNAANTQQLFVVDGAGNTSTAGTVTISGDLHANGANTYTSGLTASSIICTGLIYARGSSILLGPSDNIRLYYDSSTNLHVSGGNVTADGSINTNTYLACGLGGSSAQVYFSDTNHYIQWDGNYIRSSHALTAPSLACPTINLDGNDLIAVSGTNLLYRTAGQHYFQSNGGVNWFVIGPSWIDVASTYGIRYNARTDLGSAYGVQFYWNANGYLRAVVDNNVIVDLLPQVCDERLKQDIAPSTYDCLANLNKIELYRFSWKDHTTPGAPKAMAAGDVVPCGLVAQRLNEIVPHCVMPGDSKPTMKATEAPGEGNVVWQTNTNNLIAMLIGAVQQLTARVAALEGAATPR